MNFGNANLFWNSLDFPKRLALGISSILAIILATGYYSLFKEFEQSLQVDFDNTLYNYAEDLLKDINTDSLPATVISNEVFWGKDKIFPFPHGDALVKIYTTQKQELFTYTTDKEAPQNLSSVLDLLSDIKSEKFIDIISPTGAEWRGVILPLHNSKTPKKLFFVAVPEKKLLEQISKFRSLFIAGQVIILFLSSLMITFMSKGLLKSLKKLSGDIRTVSFQDSHFLFEVPAGPPEINLLTNKLNLLMSKIHQTLVNHQEFMANTAHQLKTPLTIAKGHLEQIAKELNPVQSQKLQVVAEELDLLAGIINNLLALVHIESGFQKISFSESDILDLLMNEIDHLDFLARKKDLKFQVICQDEQAIDAERTSTARNSSWIASTDPQLLSMLLEILLENAIKYASVSPIEILLSQNANLIGIQVQNKTHSQLDEAALHNLTKKFVRGNSPEIGQGLGLYIAYKISLVLKVDLEVHRFGESFHALLKIPVENKFEPQN